MAKDIRECLLEQAIKFHQWQEATYPGKTSEELGGIGGSLPHISGCLCGLHERM